MNVEAARAWKLRERARLTVFATIYLLVKH